MAARVLNRTLARVLALAVAHAVALAALVAGALALSGCPHDWATYSSVSTDEARGDAGPGASKGDAAAEGGSAAEADSGGPPGGDLVFATFPDRAPFIEADATGIVLATTGGSVVSCDHHDCTTSMRSIASMQHDIRALAIGDDYVACAPAGPASTARASSSEASPTAVSASCASMDLTLSGSARPAYRAARSRRATPTRRIASSSPATPFHRTR
jgi:hypothetical protein